MKLVWKQILVTFALSFVLGAFVGRWQEHCHMGHKRPSHENREKWILKKLDKKLHLNADQKPKVEAILQEAAPRMKELRAEMWPKFNETRKATNEKIRVLLDESQQKKFDEMEAEWEARMKDRP